MPVTIHDVAKKAGVSISTVSRVLNGYRYVSEPIKAQVMMAVNELEYKPNQVARGLASQHTNLIGIIVPDLTNHYYSRMISSIEEYASNNEFNIIICNINENLEKEKIYINILKNLWASGIILMHEKIDLKTKELLVKSKIPIVLASVKLGTGKFPSVNINDFQAAYDATEYLIKLGHTKIALISGDMRDYTSGQQRYLGYLKAHKDYNIEVIEDYIQQGYFKIQDGYDAMNHILNVRETIPTAVFAVSDTMAIGAINCAIDRGYSVPGDISVIGFDNIDLAEAVRPRLTTINQPAEEIGKIAIKMLLDLIRGKEVPSEVIIGHTLIEGGTCKKSETL